MQNSPINILLAEDNEDDVFLMHRALKAIDLASSLHSVEDGQQAIDYLAGAGKYADRSAFPYPTIVFLDLKMPYRSGFDVLAWIASRSDLPRPYTVVLSSSNDPQDISRSHELGAQDHLVKPPRPAKLMELFSALGAQANGLESGRPA